MQRLKRGILPPSPTSVSEILSAYEIPDIFNVYGVSIHGNEYVFYNGAVETTQYSFCVFSSKKTCELIERNIPPAERHILMDATFRTVPKGPFKQLLLMYIRKGKQVEKLKPFFVLPLAHSVLLLTQ